MAIMFRRQKFLDRRLMIAFEDVNFARRSPADAQSLGVIDGQGSPQIEPLLKKLRKAMDRPVMAAARILTNLRKKKKA